MPRRALPSGRSRRKARRGRRGIPSGRCTRIARRWRGISTWCSRCRTSTSPPSAPGNSTWRSTASAAPAARRFRCCSSASAARSPRSTSRPTAASRARPSRCRRTWASCPAPCARAARRSAWPSTRTWTAWRWWTRPAARSARTTRWRFAVRAVLGAHLGGPEPTIVVEPLDEPGGGGRGPRLRRPVRAGARGRGQRGARMRKQGAPVGGEGNGGVILPELHLGRDAPVGVALILHYLARPGRRFRRWSRPRPGTRS